MVTVRFLNAEKEEYHRKSRLIAARQVAAEVSRQQAWRYTQAKAQQQQQVTAAWTELQAQACLASAARLEEAAACTRRTPGVLGAAYVEAQQFMAEKEKEAAREVKAWNAEYVLERRRSTIAGVFMEVEREAYREHRLQTSVEPRWYGWAPRQELGQARKADMEAKRRERRVRRAASDAMECIEEGEEEMEKGGSPRMATSARGGGTCLRSSVSRFHSPTSSLPPPAPSSSHSRHGDPCVEVVIYTNEKDILPTPTTTCRSPRQASSSFQPFSSLHATVVSGLPSSGRREASPGVDTQSVHHDPAKEKKQAAAAHIFEHSEEESGDHQRTRQRHIPRGSSHSRAIQSEGGEETTPALWRLFPLPSRGTRTTSTSPPAGLSLPLYVPWRSPSTDAARRSSTFPSSPFSVGSKVGEGPHFPVTTYFEVRPSYLHAERFPLQREETEEEEDRKGTKSGAPITLSSQGRREPTTPREGVKAHRLAVPRTTSAEVDREMLSFSPPPRPRPAPPPRPSRVAERRKRSTTRRKGTKKKNSTTTTPYEMRNQNEEEESSGEGETSTERARERYFMNDRHVRAKRASVRESQHRSAARIKAYRQREQEKTRAKQQKQAAAEEEAAVAAATRRSQAQRRRERHSGGLSSSSPRSSPSLSSPVRQLQGMSSSPPPLSTSSSLKKKKKKLLSVAEIIRWCEDDMARHDGIYLGQLQKPSPPTFQDPSGEKGMDKTGGRTGEASPAFVSAFAASSGPTTSHARYAQDGAASLNEFEEEENEEVDEEDFELEQQRRLQIASEEVFERLMFASTFSPPPRLPSSPRPSTTSSSHATAVEDPKPAEVSPSSAAGTPGTQPASHVKNHSTPARVTKAVASSSPVAGRARSRRTRRGTRRGRGRADSGTTTRVVPSTRSPFPSRRSHHPPPPPSLSPFSPSVPPSPSKKKTQQQSAKPPSSARLVTPRVKTTPITTTATTSKTSTHLHPTPHPTTHAVGTAVRRSSPPKSKSALASSSTTPSRTRGGGDPRPPRTTTTTPPGQVAGTSKRGVAGAPRPLSPPRGTTTAVIEITVEDSPSPSRSESHKGPPTATTLRQGSSPPLAKSMHQTPHKPQRAPPPRRSPPTFSPSPSAEVHAEALPCTSNTTTAAAEQQEHKEAHAIPKERASEEVDIPIPIPIPTITATTIFAGTPASTSSAAVAVASSITEMERGPTVAVPDTVVTTSAPMPPRSGAVEAALDDVSPPAEESPATFPTPPTTTTTAVAPTTLSFPPPSRGLCPFPTRRVVFPFEKWKKKHQDLPPFGMDQGPTTTIEMEYLKDESSPPVVVESEDMKDSKDVFVTSLPEPTQVPHTEPSLLPSSPTTTTVVPTTWSSSKKSSETKEDSPTEVIPEESSSKVVSSLPETSRSTSNTSLPSPQEVIPPRLSTTGRDTGSSSGSSSTSTTTPRSSGEHLTPAPQWTRATTPGTWATHHSGVHTTAAVASSYLHANKRHGVPATITPSIPPHLLEKREADEEIKPWNDQWSSSTLTSSSSSSTLTSSSSVSDASTPTNAHSTKDTLMNTRPSSSRGRSAGIQKSREGRGRHTSDGTLPLASSVLPWSTPERSPGKRWYDTYHSTPPTPPQTAIAAAAAAGNALRQRLAILRLQQQQARRRRGGGRGSSTISMSLSETSATAGTPDVSSAHRETSPVRTPSSSSPSLSVRASGEEGRSGTTPSNPRGHRHTQEVLEEETTPPRGPPDEKEEEETTTKSDAPRKNDAGLLSTSSSMAPQERLKVLLLRLRSFPSSSSIPTTKTTTTDTTTTITTSNGTSSLSTSSSSTSSPSSSRPSSIFTEEHHRRTRPSHPRDGRDAVVNAARTTSSTPPPPPRGRIQLRTRSKRARSQTKSGWSSEVHHSPSTFSSTSSSALVSSSLSSLSSSSMLSSESTLDSVSSPTTCLGTQHPSPSISSSTTISSSSEEDSDTASHGTPLTPGGKQQPHEKHLDEDGSPSPSLHRPTTAMRGSRAVPSPATLPTMTAAQLREAVQRLGQHLKHKEGAKQKVRR